MPYNPNIKIHYWSYPAHPYFFRTLIQTKKDSIQEKEHSHLIQVLDGLVDEEISELVSGEDNYLK